MEEVFLLSSNYEDRPYFPRANVEKELKGFCKSLSIDLHLEEGLYLLPDLKAALLEGWGKG
jgi:hypothetical protein